MGVTAAGPPSIRCAVAAAWPGVPHQLCHFHSRHEAARPLDEADRHANKELKTPVRGVRPSERPLAGHPEAAADVIRGDCHAVRSALTDDGRAPRVASGLKRHERLTALTARVDRVEKRGPWRRPSSG
jgi:hypothetical protein